MRLRNTVHRQASQRRWSVRKGRPSLEGLECRQLLSNGNGFVQGFAFNSSNSPVSGAAVQLLTTSNTLVASTTTNSDGYYAFNNVTPGTYNVAETAAGYSTSVSGSDIQTTINPASAINGNTEIQVTVLDLSQTSNPPPPPPTFTANWNGGIVGDTVSYQLLASPYNQGPVSGTATVGQLPFTLTGNQGNLTSIFTFCSDLFHDVFANNSYTVQASLTSNTTTLSPSTVPSYSTNLGEIGYLYNTFATNLSLGPSSSINTNGAALQVAFWALEYNVMPSSGPMTVTSPAHPGTPFSATGTSSAILSAADTYLADAYNNGTPKAEDAYFLNLYKPGANNSGQGMLSTDLLNFTNSPLSINTSQQPPTATVGTSIVDKATVSGGNNPTGTVTFNLYNNPNGTGTPLFTNTEPLSGGMATSAGYTATATGTDYWVATYNGDSNNATVSSGTAAEPVTITPASPSINTSQQPATATVGTLIADKATVSGGYNPTGTVTFNLYNNSTASGTPLFTDTETLSGGMATSTGYTATATGTDYWVATYNGDTNNKSVSSGTAAEPVVISPASPRSTPPSSRPPPPSAPRSPTRRPSAAGSTPPARSPSSSTPTRQRAARRCSPTPSRSPAAWPPRRATSRPRRAPTTGSPPTTAIATTSRSRSGTAAEPVTITPASPTINTSQQPATATVGTSIADKATVSGGNNPTGTVTFNLYNNSTASGTPLFTDTNVTLSAAWPPRRATPRPRRAPTTGSPPTTATQQQAVSSGTAAEPVTITPASPTINTSQQPATATVGTSIADKATVSGGNNPTGTVTFNLYNNPNGTGTPLFTDTEPLAGGMATSAGYTATATGTDYWVATYNGDTTTARSPAAPPPSR